MKFTEAVKEMARRFDKTGELATFQELAKPAVNLAYLDVGKSWRWKHLETFGSIVAIPIVEVSATIVTGQQSVVIAGASALWKGRFFRKKSGENNYRIVGVDGTTLYLDQPIIEDSGTFDCEIEKRFYTLPTEVRELGSFDADQDKVVSLDNRGIRSTFPNFRPQISDVPFSVHGTDKFTDVYSAGTAASTADSDIVTGVGTAWLANVRAGNAFLFGTIEYRVRRVESDTKMVLYNLIKSPITGPYKIYQDQPMTVRMRATFMTKKVIPFNYTRSVYPLIHDEDRIELSEEAKIAVLAFAEAYLAKSLNKDDWANRLLEAQGRLNAAQTLASTVNAAFKQFAPAIPGGMGR